MSYTKEPCLQAEYLIPLIGSLQVVLTVQLGISEFFHSSGFRYDVCVLAGVSYQRAGKCLLFL